MQLGKHELRLLEDVAPGVAAELVAAGVGLALAAPVLLPGIAGVVVGVAVELDREPVRRPAAVHPPAPGGAVGLGEREAGVAKKLQEPLLEPAQAHLRITAHDATQLRRAGSDSWRGLRPPPAAWSCTAHRPRGKRVRARTPRSRRRCPRGLAQRS